MTLREYIKQAAKKKNDGCDTPGRKIRSKGKGRGAGEGRGHGPLGVPLGAKGMTGEEKEHKKTALDIAYEAGLRAALDQFLKESQDIFNPGGGFGPLATRGAPTDVPTQMVAGSRASTPTSVFGIPGTQMAAPGTTRLGGGTTMQLPKQQATAAPTMVAGRATGTGAGGA